MTGARCDSCPVPAGLACRGEALRHKCGDPRYRAYFLERATGEESPSPEAGRRREPHSRWESLLDLPPGHSARPTLRAALCPERSDDGCGCSEIRCAFWGRKRAAYNCLDCKIKERYLPPARGVTSPGKS